ncbi:MAG TPA: hypothetical protein VF765_12130 [Polyangiaceae bacterium]
MRAMRFLLGLSASSTFVGAIVAGCGSSSSPSNPVDSGSGGDVTTEAMPMPEAAPETAPPMEAMSDVCVPDADLTQLPIPDSGLGEAGSASCIMCLKGNSTCQQLLAACNASCTCVSAFEQFYACIGMPGMTFMTCGASSNLLSALPQSDLQLLYGCGLACSTSCGFTLPSDAGEGGMTTEGGGEGGTESGAD